MSRVDVDEEISVVAVVEFLQHAIEFFLKTIDRVGLLVLSRRFSAEGVYVLDEMLVPLFVLFLHFVGFSFSDGD